MNNLRADEILIQWEKSRLLTWDDFKGMADNSSPFTAFTYIWIKYNDSFDLEFIEKRSKTKFRFKYINVRTFFRSSVSWVKKADHMLIHEQGHFDLAEEHSRKVSGRMNMDLLGKSFTCNGKTKEEQLEDGWKQAKEMINEIWVEMKSEWKKLEGKYDEETKHGVLSSHQQRYDEYFTRIRK